MPTILFSHNQLAQAVKDALVTEVPAGHTNALIGIIDQTGAQVLVSFKLKDRWTATGVARHDWGGDNTAGASLVYSW